MEAANNEWSAAYNSLNGKVFPALYTKDAVLMPPGVQPINGSEAIGQFWTDLIKAGNRKNFAIEIASIQRDGKYAYQTGRWTIDQVKDNGEVTKGGSTVRIFEEQPDRKPWRVTGGYAPSVQQALSARSGGGLAAAWARGVQAGAARVAGCVFEGLRNVGAAGDEVGAFRRRQGDER